MYIHMKKYLPLKKRIDHVHTFGQRQIKYVHKDKVIPHTPTPDTDVIHMGVDTSKYCACVRTEDKNKISNILGKYFHINLMSYSDKGCR